MSEKNLYAVMNKRGKLWDFNDEDGFYYEDEAGCPLTDNKEKADKVAKLYGTHTMVLTNGNPEKEGVSEEEASLLSGIKAGIYKSNTLAIYNYLDPRGKNQSVTKALEKHLMRALINGYTTNKKEQYIVYKNLPGSQLVQAYKLAGSRNYTISYYVFSPSYIRYDSNFCFTDEEIEQYGLQNFVKKPVEG